MKKGVALLLAVIMIFSLAACGGNGDDGKNGGESQGGGSVSSAKTLNVGTMNVLGTFLQGSENETCHWGCYLVYDYLFYYDDNKEAFSDILSDWHYEEDGTTFVMTVKDGITFANGDKMTGEDVLYSIKSLVDRETNLAAYFTTIDWDRSSVSEDGMTVTLANASAFGPGVTNVGAIYIMDKKWCEEKGFDNTDPWVNSPNGSGPYEVVEYVTDSHVTLKLRDNYWGDFKATADTVTIKHYAEESAMYMALETGELDIALNISGTDYTRALSDDKIAEFVTHEGENIMLALDNANPYLKDENVRLAIAYGVNWEEVAEAAMGKDMAEVSSSVVTSVSPYYKNIGAYQYDADKAKEYMEAAGYKTDGTVNFTITMNTVDQSVKKNAATVIQYYLQQLGINLTANYTDFPTAFSSWMKEGGTDINFQDSDTGSIAGEPYISLRFFPENMAMFPVAKNTDEKFNTLFKEANFTTDESVRKAKYEELQQYVHDKAFFIPLYESVKATAYNPEKISTIDLQSAISANLRYVTLK